MQSDERDFPLGNAQARSQVRAEGGENMVKYITDTALLNNAIKESGKKIGYLAKACGLSRQGFDNCRNNVAEFKGSHIKILCDELGITKLTDRERIFFARSDA